MKLFFYVCLPLFLMGLGMQAQNSSINISTALSEAGRIATVDEILLDGNVIVTAQPNVMTVGNNFIVTVSGTISSSQLTVLMYSGEGALIYSQTITPTETNINNTTVSFNMSAPSNSGVYLIKVVDMYGKTGSTKIIVH
ncbi:MAG: T9SS type A sorting domain-containing protein [Sphingobacteriales bacterium]|nr:T9SS type A sorting domain-containing protein [Sphingobacteriales bacterium]